MAKVELDDNAIAYLVAELESFYRASGYMDWNTWTTMTAEEKSLAESARETVRAVEIVTLVRAIVDPSFLKALEETVIPEKREEAEMDERLLAIAERLTEDPQ